jgi:glycosyltransferase involved in cell wall biosynthesis
VLGGFFSALFQPLFKYHLVSEIHGEHILRPMGSSLISKIKFKFFKIFSMFNFSVAKSIRTLSPSMTTMIENVYGIQIAEKVYFVPNRVDMKVFNKYKTDYGIGDTLKIITVGRFTKLKNHMSLIQDLYKSNINFDLTIIGGGQLKTQYLALIKELKIEDRVHIYDNLSQNEICELLCKSDIYVHYSVSEGVPRAILEAMAIGLPVIVSKVGYVQGILIDGDNSKLISTNEPKALIEAINFFSKESNRKIIGTKARQDIIENFSWENVFTKYRKFILS